MPLPSHGMRCWSCAARRIVASDRGARSFGTLPAGFVDAGRGAAILRAAARCGGACGGRAFDGRRPLVTKLRTGLECVSCLKTDRSPVEGSDTSLRGIVSARTDAAAIWYPPCHRNAFSVSSTVSSRPSTIVTENPRAMRSARARSTTRGATYLRTSRDTRSETVALLVVTLRPVLKSAARRSTTATAR